MPPPRRVYLPPVPRAKAAGGWSPLIGFRKVVRPASVPVGRFLRPVQGIPLTGGQGSTIVSTGGSSGGPQLVQSASGNVASGTTITVTLGSVTTAGNCLVVAIGSFQSTSNPTVTGITLGGSAGNFAVAKQANGANQSDCEVWVDWNCAGGQTSVVITFAAGSGASQGNTALVMEWSGLISGSTPVDKTNGANGTAASFSSGSSGTLSQANELIIGAVAQDLGSGAVIAGPGSPWTNLAQVNSSNNSGLVASYLVVSSTAAQTYAGTFPGTAGFGTVVVTLKAVSAPVVTVGGLATISVGPQGLGNVWYPAQVTVQTSSGAADASTCSIYLGPAGVPVTLVGTIFPGGIGTLALAVPPMQPGDYLIAQWTGGNPGDAAAVNVIGTMDSLMPG